MLKTNCHLLSAVSSPCDLLDLQGIWDSEDNDFAPGACWAFDGLPQSRYTLWCIALYSCRWWQLYIYHGWLTVVWWHSRDLCRQLRCQWPMHQPDWWRWWYQWNIWNRTFIYDKPYLGTYYPWAVPGWLVKWAVTAGPFLDQPIFKPPCHFTCLDKEGILSGDIEIPEPEVFECSDYTLTHTTKVTGDECIGENIVIEYIVTDLWDQRSKLQPTHSHPAIEHRRCVVSGKPCHSYMQCRNNTTGNQQLFWRRILRLPICNQLPWRCIVIDNATCNIHATHHDAVIAACGTACLGNSKIVRIWTLLDWCTLETANYVQIIKAVDTKSTNIHCKRCNRECKPMGLCSKLPGTNDMGIAG